MSDLVRAESENKTQKLLNSKRIRRKLPETMSLAVLFLMIYDEDMLTKFIDFYAFKKLRLYFIDLLKCTQTHFSLFIFQQFNELSLSFKIEFKFFGSIFSNETNYPDCKPN